jgi:hypothetical protein
MLISIQIILAIIAICYIIALYKAVRYHEKKYEHRKFTMKYGNGRLN